MFIQIFQRVLDISMRRGSGGTLSRMYVCVMSGLQYLKFIGCPIWVDRALSVAAKSCADFEACRLESGQDA